MTEVELRDTLRPAIKRDREMLVGTAVIALAITVAAVQSPRARSEPSLLVTWFVGCAVFALIGRAWYRWHRRRCDEMIAAALEGVPVRNVSIARFTINWIIPFGHVVALDIGKLKNQNVGFWRRRDAERFVAVIAGGAYSGTGELPTARALE